MTNSLRRLLMIAQTTFLEAARQKFFNFLLLVAVGMVACSVFFQQFDFGSSELKFIVDLGFGTIVFFGSIIAVVLAAQLFFSEIENRTALTILARPVTRHEFVLAKQIGIVGLLFSFVTVLLFLLSLILFLRENSLMEQYPDAFSEGRLVRYPEIFLFGLIQIVKLGVIAAFTLFIGSFSRSNLYTVAVSFLGLLIFQLQYVAHEAYRDDASIPARFFLRVIGLVFPNFQVFNVGDMMVSSYGVSISGGSIARILLYGAIYTAVFLALAIFAFREREV